jgi:hypothetical protein
VPQKNYRYTVPYQYCPGTEENVSNSTGPSFWVIFRLQESYHDNRPGQVAMIALSIYFPFSNRRVGNFKTKTNYVYLPKVHDVNTRGYRYSCFIWQILPPCRVELHSRSVPSPCRRRDRTARPRRALLPRFESPPRLA